MADTPSVSLSDISDKGLTSSYIRQNFGNLNQIIMLLRTHPDLQAIAASDPTSRIPFLPVELEIEIIRHVSLSEYGTIGRVCKRWYSITLLPDVKYTTAHSQQPRKPSPSFKHFSFQIHRAIYEIDRLWGPDESTYGFRYPDRDVMELLERYEHDSLTIPPMPHTLQDVKIAMYLPQSATRPNRPGPIMKNLTIPTKKNRKLLLNINPHNSNDIELLNLQGGKDLPHITVGEFFRSMTERGRMRTGDITDSVEFKWRIGRNNWWDEWGLRPAFYDIVVIRYGQRVDNLTVWVEGLGDDYESRLRF